MKFIYRQLPVAVAVAISSTCATAQVGTIEEIIVSAQKQLSSLQDTPIAMSAFDERALESMGTVDFSGVAVASPSLNFTPYPSSSNTLILFMRGQGANDAGQITKEGAVGMYVDGVYMSRPQAMTMDLADVESIEVLRGPQGTLYGRNTTGGAINITTKKPSGEFNFKEHLTFGNRGKFRSMTMVDLPAVGNVAAKVSYVTSEKDGYVDNPGGNDFGLEDQQGARLAVNWEASESVLVDYAYETGNFESTPVYYQNDMLAAFIPGYSTQPHSKSYRASELRKSDADFESHSLTVEWELSDELTIKSISGYRELETQFYQDYLESLFGISYYVTANDMENRQWSQELQFVGSALDDRLDYVAGLYYFEESSRQYYSNDLLDIQANFGPGLLPFSVYRNTDAQSTSWAVFMQGTYVPNILEERLSLTVGLRYTEDTRKGVRDNYLEVPAFAPFDVIPLAANIKNDVDYDSVDPTLTANYAWTDDLSTYAKFSTAYKAGGFGESAADFTLEIQPEEISSYELGLKSYWFDRHVRLNMAAFWTDYDDMQLDLSPDPVNISVVNTYNAGTAAIDGLELDLLIQPIENLRLTIDYTYLDWQIDEVSHPTTGADITNEFVLPYAPTHSYHVGVDYTFDQMEIGLLDLRIDYSWQDETYMTSGATSSQSVQKAWTRDDYGLLDARLTLSVDMDSGSQLRIAVWGKNIENKQYATHRFFAGAGSTVAWNEPETYGLDVIYEF